MIAWRWPIVFLLIPIGCHTARSASPGPTAAFERGLSVPADRAPSPKVVVDKRSDQLFREGIVAFESKEFATAISRFRETLKKTPNFVPAAYNLALSFKAAGRGPEAEAIYRAALAIDAQHGPSLYNLGLMLASKGDSSSALQLYQQALVSARRLSTSDQETAELPVLIALSDAYREKKNFTQAIIAALSVLEKKPDNSDALIALALVYGEEGKTKLADILCARAIKGSPKDARPNNVLGVIHARAGDTGIAVAYFNQALAKNSAYFPAAFNSGALALFNRDFANAEKYFKRAIDLRPEVADAHLYYAFALEGSQAPQKAETAAKEFEEALRLNPILKQSVCGAGFAYSRASTIRADFRSKAIGLLTECKKFSSLAPNFPEFQLQNVEAKLQVLKGATR